ncbi:hypothetical protein HHI36_018313 [Cryptolaemus montrouzieri]|uniref:Uncharacterized protein n=1 Tax=Cryptolaemus montrouzieri TaxID=559131 RepID=A0ABD2NZZ9_9CUCU
MEYFVTGNQKILQTDRLSELLKLTQIKDNNEDDIVLPPVSLSSVDDKYEKWPGFSNTFEALMSVQKSISTARKFFYLRSSLSGSAFRIIEPLTISDTNYDSDAER